MVAGTSSALDRHEHKFGQNAGGGWERDFSEQCFAGVFQKGKKIIPPG